MGLAGVALLTPLSSTMDLKETVKKMDALASSFKALNQKCKDFVNREAVVVPDANGGVDDDDESIEDLDMYEDDMVGLVGTVDDMPMDPMDDMPMDDMDDMPMDKMPMDDMEDYPEEVMEEEAEQEARRRSAGSGRRRWG